MIENSVDELEQRLSKALAEYDWPETGQICEDLAALINKDSDAVPTPRLKRIIHRLRRKRLFANISVLAEAAIGSGNRDPQIRRQYAQCLIDQNLLSAAESVLRDILSDSSTSKAEELEAIGLLGRVYKQRFVTAAQAETDQKQPFIEQAVKEYFLGYSRNNESYWHSINVVALVMRGIREGMSLSDAPDANSLASGIFDLVKGKIDSSVEGPKPWELATMLETQIALGQYAEAADTAYEYSMSPDADAFEIDSTLRQLIEIWQLDEAEPPGDKVLPILHAALLEREGGSVRIESKNAAKERINLEGTFGDNAPKSITWFKEGLDKSSSVARIETRDGRGIGTGGLFQRKDFFPDSEGLLLMTNAHVVSKHPADSGLMARQVRANFQGVEETFEIDEIVWSSPQRELDTSLLSIKGEPSAKPLQVSETAAQMDDPAPRLYVIGHPSGRDLEISLNDNRMVGANETFVHYRTPTEPGSSGSPVFDQYGWDVVALHHGGSDNLPRIDGSPGTYQANEGIAIQAIRNAIRQ